MMQASTPIGNKHMSNNSRLVYSSDGGRVSSKPPEPAARRSKPRKGANKAPPTAPADGVVRIHRSTKGRRGKGVCLITGLPESGDALKALAKKLKQACGTGGAVKDGVVEIQGDNRDKIKAELEKLGYTVKLAGG